MKLSVKTLNITLNVNKTKSYRAVNRNLIMFVDYVLFLMYNNDTKLSHFCEIHFFVIYYFVL